MDYTKYITRYPTICGGEPVIKGTRITLRTILASLTESAGDEEILNDFPSLTKDALRAAIAFASASTQEDMPISRLPNVA